MTKHEFLNELEEINNPEIAYILGFIWADGHVYKGNCGKVVLEIKSEDAIELLNIFSKLNFCKIYKRSRNGRKPTTSFNIYSNDIYSFFVKNDYLSKSSVSASKILSKIPERIKQYWFRGLIDGDGSIRAQKVYRKNIEYKIASLVIYGPIQQDWSFLELLCKKLKSKYSIKKRYRKTGYSSEFGVFNRKHIIAILDYVFNKKEKDKIGLSRKYNTYLEIKEYDKVMSS